MKEFIIVESDSGLTVAEVPPGKSAEDVAAGLGAVLVDSGPYRTFEDAEDAMLSMPDDEEERATLRD